MPNHDRALIPIEKLRDYVLNPEHPDGRHKAKVFKEALGIERQHAGVFAELIAVSLERSPAQAGIRDAHGQRWTTHHEIIGLNGRPFVVTVVWIIGVEQADIPRLVSCYIEVEKQERLRRLLEGG